MDVASNLYISRLLQFNSLEQAKLIGNLDLINIYYDPRKTYNISFEEQIMYFIG